MSDREKAIRILEGNYKDFVLRHNGELITVNELITLLRTQEAVKPTRKVNENGQILSCGNCGAWFIVQKQKYCHECGKAVKWK